MWVWPLWTKRPSMFVNAREQASIMDRDNSCHPPEINVMFKGHLVTCQAHTTIWQNLLLQTTNANQGESWPGKLQQRLKVIQGVAVDDIPVRSFVMPDDASTLALQRGPYWTHKRSKIYRHWRFSTQLQNVSRCSIQLAPAVARRKKIRAKRNMRSMPVKIKVVLYPAPLSSPQTSTPQEAQTNGWHRVMDIAMAFPKIRPAWIDNKHPKPWAKPPERPKKCCQLLSSI